MIPSLAVLGLVVDYAEFACDGVAGELGIDFNLAGVKISLKVGRIIPGIPQAELDARKGRKLDRPVAVICHRELPDFQASAQIIAVSGFSQRHEIAGLGLDPLVGGADHRIPQTVTAGIVLQVAASGLPRGRPVPAGVYAIQAVIAQVEVAPTGIEGHIVVAIARDSPQARIAVKRIAASRIGDEAKVVLAAQIVDPGQGSVGPGNHVLAACIVIITVTHDLQGSPFGNAPDARGS